MHWVREGLLAAILLLSSIACNQAIDEGRQNEQQPIAAQSVAEALDVISSYPEDGSRRMNPSDTIAKHRQKIMALPEVKGMALGSCPKKPRVHCIVIYSTSETWPDGLPRQLDGYTVIIKKINTNFRPL